MNRKVFLRIDRDSLHPDDLSGVTEAASIAPVDSPESCFAFSFDEMDLDHACLLLGRNKERFGHDLRHYVRSACGFFQDTPDGFVTMPDVGADFKRRFSEDLGVSIGTLFMVQAVRLRWETVAHIPGTKTLKGPGKTPDFVGFSVGGRKRVYECKGTTQPQDVDTVRHKAKEQLAAHREDDVRKWALVTYLPTSTKLIPPFLFVSDPPSDLPNVSLDLCIGIHYSMVAEFSGFEQTLDALKALLTLRVQLSQYSSNGGEPPWKVRGQYRPLAEKLLDTYQAEQPRIRRTVVNGEQFIGVVRAITIGQQVTKVFTGVRVAQFEAVLQMLQQAPGSAPSEGSQSVIAGQSMGLSIKSERFSMFSDGTLFLID
ncbi:MAG TPA: hypothetical protein VHY91_05390 [Pirellulales bacterium]|jgi:hypothetical protein|nr:hypothetical protein [Pirellulales bacterium]